MHNDLRARHHAPPLQWSQECFELAEKQVQVCAHAGCLEQGNCEGRSGLHGQNLGNKSSSPSRLALSWYNELVRWVYNFEDHDAAENQMCESFTQIVWFETQYIGVAQSGDFVVANYFPAGNVDGAFETNVLPAPLDVMEHSFRGRTAWFRSMTPDVSAFVSGLADCVPVAKSANKGACIKEVEDGLNGGQVCFIRENGEVSTCVKKNFAINRFKRPLKPEFRTRMPKDVEAAWQKLPEVHTQFKEIEVSVPVRRAPARSSMVGSQQPGASRAVSRGAGSRAGGQSGAAGRQSGADSADAVQQVFIRSDENKDGFLQINELGNVMGSLGMNKKDAAKLLKAVDKNGDGKVDIAEFIGWIFSGSGKASSALSNVPAGPPSSSAGGKGSDQAGEEAVRRAFAQSDSNSDGFLQPKELERLMEPTGMDKAQIQKLVKAVDKNGDGKVDANEFLNWVFSGSKLANKTREVI